METFAELVYGYVLAGVGAFFLLFCLVNIRWITAHTKPIRSYNGPKVSVLVPARNEEPLIRNCVDSLLNQTYLNYDILLLNDNSEDGTLAILEEYARKYPEKVRCFDGKPLPDDWQGKCFAMDQLVAAADGEILLFTDADTVHAPDSVAWAAANLEQNGAHLVSGYIRQELLTAGERFTVPLMFMLVNFILLLPLDKIFRNPMFAVAIGQYIAVRASAFRAVGGYGAVRKMTTEDMYIARNMKKAGYKTALVRAENAARCRMYTSYRAAISGIGKNIFDFFEKRSAVLFVILAALIVFLAFPPFLALYKAAGIVFLGRAPDTLAVCLLIHLALIGCTWLAVFIFHKTPRLTALFYPVLFVNLVFMAVHSWYTTTFGAGYLWKGRTIK